MDEKVKAVAAINRSLDSELDLIADANDEASEAAKRLSERRKADQLLTAKTRELSLDFLTAKPDKLKLLLDKAPDFFKICQESGTVKAAEIIEAIVDRYTNQEYSVDCDTLTFIGIHLSKNGFKQEAIRCFNRAEVIISK